jgi:hypothetical protein
MSLRNLRCIALALSICAALPAFAESTGAQSDATVPATAVPSSTPLTVAQSREVQALLGFDVAIQRIIPDALAERPAHAKMTPKQRECVLGLATPVFQSIFDAAFIELFVDAETLEGWKTFATTPGGKIFVGTMRATALAKVGAGPEPDIAAAMAALGDAEKADIGGFMMSPPAAVLKKPFPDADFPPGAEAELEARTRKECGVVLDEP